MLMYSTMGLISICFHSSSLRQSACLIQSLQHNNSKGSSCTHHTPSLYMLQKLFDSQSFSIQVSIPGHLATLIRTIPPVPLVSPILVVSLPFNSCSVLMGYNAQKIGLVASKLVYFTYYYT